MKEQNTAWKILQGIKCRGSGQGNIVYMDQNWICLPGDGGIHVCDTGSGGINQKLQESDLEGPNGGG